jgi:ribosome-associated protein
MIISESKQEKLISECRFSASRSGGAGGQNVNKVNTKVELRFNVRESAVLSDEEKILVESKLYNRINADNEIVLTCSTERSQLKNKVGVTKRFVKLVERALIPQKDRRKTKPTLASKIKRLQRKKIQSEKKQLRKKIE